MGVSIVRAAVPRSSRTRSLTCVSVGRLGRCTVPSYLRGNGRARRKPVPVDGLRAQENRPTLVGVAGCCPMSEQQGKTEGSDDGNHGHDQCLHDGWPIE
jgi:hypothetical protein